MLGRGFSGGLDLGVAERRGGEGCFAYGFLPRRDILMVRVLPVLRVIPGVEGFLGRPSEGFALSAGEEPRIDGRGHCLRSRVCAAAIPQLLVWGASAARSGPLHGIRSRPPGL